MSIIDEYQSALDIINKKIKRIEDLFSQDKEHKRHINEVLISRIISLRNQVKILETKIYLYNKGLDYFEIEELLNGN